ncbi:nucleotide exchange factor GrpE [Dactylosporangium sp. AC04546]|uniref:nucleotide exchange factor GrpE n=1 Tax=Dactylosporangium sp. AC04546 TaxID=2862460 RepID=UPI001EDDBD43|nr:nucleotide exchange factor GrpE [Dactylosporangium sp. AC04546]WVK88378.1 nucleotide exchange factor GrpE [Dactylosporangium sp. AC04546]
MSQVNETPATERTDEDLRDQWQRALAEVENTRKWAARNAADQRLAERLAVSAAWLPVLDHLDLALQHAEADPQSIVAGVEQVREQARRVLSLLGFTPIDATGVAFDPLRHEAAEVDRDSDAPPGTVTRIIRPGFAKGERLLRPAIVAVSAPPPLGGVEQPGGPDGDD